MDFGGKAAENGLNEAVLWLKKSKNAQRFMIGVEFLHSYPDTIRLLIKHLYSREGEIRAPVL